MRGIGVDRDDNLGDAKGQFLISDFGDRDSTSNNHVERAKMIMDGVQVERTTDDTSWLNCECPVCGKLFHLKPSRIKRCKHNYCSKKCHYEAKKEYMAGNGNHQFGLKGDKNASWKSDRQLSKYGYVQVRVLDHPFRDKSDFVFEHRLIAEKYLLTNDNSVVIDGKRYLSKDYVVHHKNFHRTDNRVENLIVMTKAEHQSLHAKLNANGHDEKGRFLKNSGIIKVKKVTETAIIPRKGTEDSAGYDLFVDIDKEIDIKPHETVMLQTNIAFSIPRGYYGAVFARSGLSTKFGIRPANCVAVIDADYRGSVGVPLHNDSSNVYTIKPHERVAQIVFMEAPRMNFEIVDKLDKTDRGTCGFGSTGR